MPLSATRLCDASPAGSGRRAGRAPRVASLDASSGSAARLATRQRAGRDRRRSGADPRRSSGATARVSSRPRGRCARATTASCVAISCSRGRRIRNFLGQWRSASTLADGAARRPHGSRRQAASRRRRTCSSEWCCSALGLPQRREHAPTARSGCCSSSTTRSASPTSTSTAARAPGESRRVREAVADFRASSERYQRAGDVLGVGARRQQPRRGAHAAASTRRGRALLHRARRVTQAANYPLGTLDHASAACRGSPHGAATPGVRSRCSRQALAGFARARCRRPRRRLARPAGRDPPDRRRLAGALQSADAARADRRPGSATSPCCRRRLCRLRACAHSWPLGRIDEARVRLRARDRARRPRRLSVRGRAGRDRARPDRR